MESIRSIRTRDMTIRCGAIYEMSAISATIICVAIIGIAVAIHCTLAMPITIAVPVYRTVVTVVPWCAYGKRRQFLEVKRHIGIIGIDRGRDRGAWSIVAGRKWNR